MGLSLSDLSVPGLGLRLEGGNSSPMAVSTRTLGWTAGLHRIHPPKSQCPRSYDPQACGNAGTQLGKSRSNTKNSSSRSCRQRPETRFCGSSWLLECQAEAFWRGGCEVAGILRCKRSSSLSSRRGLLPIEVVCQDLAIHRLPTELCQSTCIRRCCLL